HFDGPQQAAWMDRLEQEHANLRAALGWTVECGEAEPGLRLASALWRFWLWRGHRSEGHAWLARLLAAPGAKARTAVRAKALSSAGNLALLQCDFAGARALLEEGVAIGRELGESGTIGDSLFMLGMAADITGDYAGAKAFSDEAL